MSHPVQEKKSKPLVCVVTSDKMQKTRVGVVTRFVQHAVYKKYLKRRTKVMFHDPENQTKTGDKVLLSLSKPQSKRKAFQLVKVLEQAAE